MNKHIVRGCVLAGVLAICYGALAQTTGPRMPPLTIPSLAGRDLFEFYCATCHGRDGSGHGWTTSRRCKRGESSDNGSRTSSHRRKPTGR